MPMRMKMKRRRKRKSRFRKNRTPKKKKKRKQRNGRPLRQRKKILDAKANRYRNFTFKFQLSCRPSSQALFVAPRLVILEKPRQLSFLLNSFIIRSRLITGGFIL